MATALRSLDGSGRFACRPVLNLLLKPSRRSTRGDRTRTRHHANTMHGTRTDVTARRRPSPSARGVPTLLRTGAVRPWPCARTPCVGCERSSQSVSQLFHGPAPRSPLHRLAVRLRHGPRGGSVLIRSSRHHLSLDYSRAPRSGLRCVMTADGASNMTLLPHSHPAPRR